MATRCWIRDRFSAPAIAALLAWAAIAPSVHAQTLVYKWVGRDGITSYSQTPPRKSGARAVQTIDIETLPADQQQAARRMLAHLQRTADARAAAARHRLAAADERVRLAISALRRAEAALRTGSVPAGTDRIGKVGGGSRLRDTYFQRVSRLEAKVQRARRSLDEAYAARNAVR